MRVRFWGTRGSVPTPGRETARYGGNTPCISVDAGAAAPLIFDAGTGVRALGLDLAALPDEPLELFLSHTHWDHIQGLPFFAPLYQRDRPLRIWGADDPPGTLERTMQTLMAPAVFPVPFESAGARVEFRPLPFDGVSLGGVTVRAIPVHHPGGAAGFRLQSGDAAMVYVPDNELRGSDGPPAAVRRSLREACRGAAVLIHDSTYTAEESPNVLGWGHSTADEAVALALETEVQTLILFHHAPQRTDEEVDRLVEHCRTTVRNAGSRLRVMAAAEGETFVVENRAPGIEHR
jgi:phosphoribosyl 1,2-cyclic phosphodiesterase